MEAGTVKKISLQLEGKGSKQLTKQSISGVKKKIGKVKRSKKKSEGKVKKKSEGKVKKKISKSKKSEELPFWEPLVDATANKRRKKLEQLKQNLTFDADVVIDFITKLDVKPEKTFAGKLEYLQKKIILFPSLGDEKINVLKELHKLLKEEVEQTVKMLKELYKQKADCDDLVLHDSMKSEASYRTPPELVARLPVWIGCQNEIPPPMCGAIPTCQISPNHFVAAFVVPNVEEIHHEELGIAGSWILARCIGYHEEKYLVTDIDEVEQPLFKVRSNGLIPLPLYRADPERNAEAIFPVGAVVLALYTKTTCFFPALIVDTPKTLGDTYTLRFRDLRNKLHWGSLTNVQQRYVIQYREAYNIFTEEDKEKLIESLGYCSVCNVR